MIQYSDQKQTLIPIPIALINNYQLLINTQTNYLKNKNTSSI